MWKSFWIGGAFLAVLTVLILAAASVSHFTMQHPRSSKVKILVSETGAVPIREVNSDQGLLQLTSTKYDFGVMDPFAKGEHLFVLSNAGPGPIRLKNMGTSCSKCTVASMSKSELAAGESAEVKIEFDVGPGPHYSQLATIGVENDPSRSSVQLRVEGRVRMHFGADPAELTLEALAPGKEFVISTLIYSQKFDEIEIVEVKCSNPDFEAELRPIDAADFPDHEPTWARELVVTIPDNLPPGHFSELIWLTARIPSPNPDEGTEVTRIDVPVKGVVNRGIQLTGETIGADGVIMLGVLPSGEEKVAHMTLKLQNKAHRDLQLTSIECVPSFLSASVQPKKGVSADLGLYDIELRVPADAPICNFLREMEQGQLLIKTENPVVGELPLSVSFAIQKDG